MDVLVSERLMRDYRFIAVDLLLAIFWSVWSLFCFPLSPFSWRRWGVLWKALRLLPTLCLWHLFSGYSGMVSLVWLLSKAWSTTSPLTFCNYLFQVSFVAMHLILGLNCGWNLTQHKQGRFAEGYTSMRESNLSQAVLWHWGCLWPHCHTPTVTTFSRMSTHSLLVESYASLC